MSRTRLEVSEELQALKDLLERVQPEDQDGNSNEDAIRAQINVIETAPTREQIRELYEDDFYVLEAALDAERWLREDDEAPSAQWEEWMEIGS